jgi:hypothetical protein
VAWEQGQSGNPNGAPKRAKIWREAIDRAIKRREQDDPLALERLAAAFIRKVEEGDIAAIKEFGDRLDGKVTQPIGGDEESAPIALSVVERLIVKAPDTNG